MDSFFQQASSVGNAPPAANSDNRDRLFTLAALALGLFFTETIAGVGLGLSVSAFIVLFYAAAFAYLSFRPGGLTRAGWPLLVAIGLVALSYGLYDNVVLQVLNVPLLCLLSALQLTAMTGNRLYEMASAGTVVDALNAMVAMPIVNIPAPFTVLMQGGKAENRKKATPVLIGVLIGLPILLLVGALLVSADFLLDTLLRDFLRNFHFSQHIVRILFGILLAIPLYGLFFALRHGKAEAKPADVSRLQRADPRTFVTVMAMVSAAYLVFIGVQFGYLFNAFSRLLPQGFTYADYARRGFGELVVVIIINLVILALSMGVSRRGTGAQGALKGMETGLVALTLLLCASELAKMALYMDAYGLTQLRVYVTWFIVLCVAFFVALCVKVYLPRFRLIRFCAGAFLVWYLALNLVDIDARIAQYNVWAYRAGQTKSVDVQMMYDLSDSAVPYLVELTGEKDPAVASKAKDVLQSRAWILDQNDWRNMTLARWRAQNILRQNNIQYVRQ